MYIDRCATYTYICMCVYICICMYLCCCSSGEEHFMCILYVYHIGCVTYIMCVSYTVYISDITCVSYRVYIYINVYYMCIIGVDHVAPVHSYISDTTYVSYQCTPVHSYILDTTCVSYRVYIYITYYMCIT